MVLMIWIACSRARPIGSRPIPTPTNAEAVRNSLGYARRFAERMNLAAMKPRPDLASTGYCPANAGGEYLVYQPKPDESFSVELNTGARYDPASDTWRPTTTASPACAK